MGTPGRSRDRSIRSKIAGLLLVPLVSLIALWGVIASGSWVTSLDLRTHSTIWTNLHEPADQMIIELQRERLLSARRLGLGGDPDDTALTVQRSRTDNARKNFRQLALSDASRDASKDATRKQVDTLLVQLERLNEIRAEIDVQLSNRLRTLEAYNDISDAIFRMLETLALIDDIPTYQQGRVLMSLAFARELLTREQALVSGAMISDNTMTTDERTLLTQWVGNRRFLIDQSLAEFDPELREQYVDIISAPTYQQLRVFEEQLIGGAPLRAGGLNSWQESSDTVAGHLQTAQDNTAASLSKRAEPIADSILQGAYLVGGLGLAVVVASIIISMRLGSRLTSELFRLRQTALELAHGRLPMIVEKLRKGEEIDVERVAPPIATRGTTAEIHDVVRAFSAVQHTAVEAAVGQAQLRKGIGQVFLNLARRSQTLLHRQRIQLAHMQEHTHEPDSLEDLFRLDHLTTRMRRHAEGLIILSGATPGRGWRKPVPMLDVMRGASAEVEDYTRVTVLPMSSYSLQGSIVGDIIHMVAELVENATVFSPPNTAVHVRGEMAANGFVIEVEDRGLGVSQEKLADLNERLLNPPEFDLAESDRLGLFVVSRLAARHGIQVTLRTSPYGGTTAIVLIPAEFVIADEEEPAPPMIAIAGPVTAKNGTPSDSDPVTGPITPVPPLQTIHSIPRPTPPDQKAPRPAPPAPPARPAAAVEHITPSPTGDAPRTARDVPSKERTALPRRVRQANLAPQLREVQPLGSHGGERESRPDPENAQTRSPEEARLLLTSLQRGWNRGRQESELSEEGEK
ncbi:sensor histidine kinase [Sinosporangium siamense]|uniref:histidine kinase n=1 Tax=Sinosporangium siamense TaxID=1367973 RepID=A0A919RFJ1_9ACTN|nr:nitrate- and nitrite sensing domain-containing protein [Sinosporangium siamense]GII91865.1 ATPase [Sinosporangium siamense]